MVVKKLSFEEAKMLLTLGFKVRKEEKVYKISLPEGWWYNLKGNNSSIIMDEKKRKRGEYKMSRKWDIGKFTLYPRYVIKYENSHIFVFDNELEDAFRRKRGFKIHFIEKWRMKKLLSSYMDKYYPDWKNPLAYWS